MGIHSYYKLTLNSKLNLHSPLVNLRETILDLAAKNGVMVSRVRHMTKRDLAGSFLYPDEATGLAMRFANGDQTLSSLPDESMGFFLTRECRNGIASGHHADEVSLFVGCCRNAEGDWMYDDSPSLWGKLTEVLKAAIEGAPKFGFVTEYIEG